MPDFNPYDFPASFGTCIRCNHTNTGVIGAVCFECMTPAEKKHYGVDQEQQTEE